MEDRRIGSLSSVSAVVVEVSAVAANARAIKKADPPTIPESPNRSPKKIKDKPAAQSGCDAYIVWHLVGPTIC